MSSRKKFKLSDSQSIKPEELRDVLKEITQQLTNNNKGRKRAMSKSFEPSSPALSKETPLGERMRIS